MTGSSRPTGVLRALGAACAVIALLAISACGPGGGGGGSSAGPSSTATVDSPALLLVPEIWRVRDAAGESVDTWIRFDLGVDLIRPKGDVGLSWSTDGDAILTRVESWSMSLGAMPTVPWLTTATRFARDGDGWAFFDADGRRTARLVRDGLPPPSTQALHDVPEVDASMRRQHADAMPGADVRPLGAADAVGTWGLPGIAVADGSIELDADGSWRARTSCDVLGQSAQSAGGGSYRLLPTGVLLLTEGGIAGTGCTEPDQPPPAAAKAIVEFSRAGSVALRGDELTDYDRTGSALGTLVRKG